MNEREKSEEWLTVPWAKDYEISTLGRVRRIGKNNYLKGSLNGNGYRKVELFVNKKPKTRTIHRIMVDTFLGGLPKGMVTNHINAIRTDNRLCNLEIVTHKQNSQHMWTTGTVRCGENHPNSKLDDCKVLVALTRSRHKWAFKATHLEAAFKINRRTIFYIRSGKMWNQIKKVIQGG